MSILLSYGPSGALVDHSFDIDKDTLQIVSSIREAASTCSFDVVIAGDQSSRPKGGNEILVTQNGAKEFNGTIRRVTQSLVQAYTAGAPALTPVLRYNVECSDWTPWLDHHPVQGKYGPVAGDFAGVILRSVVNDVTVAGPKLLTYGFSPAGIEDGLAVPQQTFNQQMFTQIIGELARQTSYLWYVDYDKVIRFFPQLSGTGAPVVDLYLDTDSANYGDFILTEDVSQVINSIIIKDFNLKNATPRLDDPVVTNAPTAFFPTAFQPNGNISDVVVEVTFPDATTKTYSEAQGNMRLELDPTDPEPGDLCFICEDNWGIRLNESIPAGSTLNKNYKFLYPAQITASHPGNIAEMKSREGTDGVWFRVISDPTLTADNETVAKQRANLLLNKYAKILLSARFESFTQGWRAGQSLTVHTATRGFGSVVMHVQQVSKTLFFNDDTGVWQLKAQVELTNTPWGE